MAILDAVIGGIGVASATTVLRGLPIWSASTVRTARAVTAANLAFVDKFICFAWQERDNDHVGAAACIRVQLARSCWHLCDDPCTCAVAAAVHQRAGAVCHAVVRAVVVANAAIVSDRVAVGHTRAVSTSAAISFADTTDILQVHAISDRRVGNARWS